MRFLRTSLFGCAICLGLFTSCKKEEKAQTASNTDTSKPDDGIGDSEILVEMGLTGSELLAEASSAFKGISGDSCSDITASTSATNPVETNLVLLPSAATANMRCIVDAMGKLLALISDTNGPIDAHRPSLVVDEPLYIDLGDSFTSSLRYARLRKHAATETYPFDIGFLRQSGSSFKVTTLVQLKDLGTDAHDSLTKITSYQALTQASATDPAYQLVSIGFDTRERDVSTKVQYTDSDGSVVATQTVPWLQSLNLTWKDKEPEGSVVHVASVWNRTVDLDTVIGPNYYSHRLAAGDVSLARAVYSDGYTVQQLAHIPQAKLSSVDFTTATGANAAFDQYSYNLHMKDFLVSEVLTKATVLPGCSSLGTVLNGYLGTSSLPASVCAVTDTGVLSTLWTDLTSACTTHDIVGQIHATVSGQASVFDMHFCTYVTRSQLVSNPQFVQRETSDWSITATTDALLSTHAAALTSLGNLPYNDIVASLLPTAKLVTDAIDVITQDTITGHLAP